MAAAMNGIALHGGFIPYGGTFLIFSDYARGAIRLSALMGVRVIYVLTHDSIGLGEDGPTHQPVEICASLRALPNMLVFRPCDAVETAESWAAALAETAAPSVARPQPPGADDPARRGFDGEPDRQGAYVLREAEATARRDHARHRLRSRDRGRRRAELAMEGIKAAVVSMPCWELFERQSEDYRARCSEPRRASASRRRCASAGTAGSARAAPSSA